MKRDDMLEQAANLLGYWEVKLAESEGAEAEQLSRCIEELRAVLIGRGVAVVSEETRKAYCLLADVVTNAVAKEVEIKVVDDVVVVKDLEGRRIEISDDGGVTIK